MGIFVRSKWWVVSMMSFSIPETRMIEPGRMILNRAMWVWSIFFVPGFVWVWFNTCLNTCYPVVNWYNHGKSPFVMGKSTTNLAISKSYVKLPVGEKAALIRDRSGTTSNVGIGITNFPVPLTSGESQVKRLWCAADVLVVLFVPWVVLNFFLPSFVIYFMCPLHLTVYASNISIPKF